MNPDEEIEVTLPGEDVALPVEGQAAAPVAPVATIPVLPSEEIALPKLEIPDELRQAISSVGVAPAAPQEVAYPLNDEGDFVYGEWEIPTSDDGLNLYAAAFESRTSAEAQEYIKAYGADAYEDGRNNYANAKIEYRNRVASWSASQAAKADAAFDQQLPLVMKVVEAGMGVPDAATTGYVNASMQWAYNEILAEETARYAQSGVSPEVAKNLVMADLGGIRNIPHHLLTEAIRRNPEVLAVMLQQAKAAGKAESTVRPSTPGKAALGAPARAATNPPPALGQTQTPLLNQARPAAAQSGMATQEEIDHAATFGITRDDPARLKAFIATSRRQRSAA